MKNSYIVAKYSCNIYQSLIISIFQNIAQKCRLVTKFDILVENTEPHSKLISNINQKRDLKMKRIILLSVVMVIINLNLTAQVYDAFGNRIPSKNTKTQIKKGENKVDSNGWKQGVWEKYYDNGNPKYKANFKDDKLVGELIRFFEDGTPSVKIVYDETGEYGDASLYNTKGKIIAEGKYYRQLKDSTWTFFSESSEKRATEEYIKGKRNGKTLIFYPGGKVAEEINWKDDLKEGDWIQYFRSGKLKAKSQHKKGKLEDSYIFYFENGDIEIKGQYKNDKEDGEWSFYDNEGKIKYVIKFNEGKVQNPEALDSLQNKKLKNLENSRQNLKDPEFYRNDPDGYIRGR